MTGQAQNDIATASGRKDAVRKAFNQEYMATQQAMSQAAERARAQVLDQKQTIASHAENVKSGTQPPQEPIGQQGSGQTAPPPPAGTRQGVQQGAPRQAQQPAQQGAPQMASDPNAHDGQQIMFEIANEIRNIIAHEIDLRMQALYEKVETALAEAFPPQAPDHEQKPGKSGSGRQKPASNKKT